MKSMLKWLLVSLAPIAWRKFQELQRRKTGL